ncbi:MAG TPA: hypothetical protein VK702_04695 [Candidatus Acidoferrum sp.]|jgi:hypothetical protein|nr:hypothetical protein [Candidatus Acidoferrum sp.]
MALFRAVVLFLCVNGLSTAESFAQTVPVWQTPADSIAILTTGGNQDFTYALVRDSSMRNHNTYCVTVGAHIGKLRVVSIGPRGVVLSNGRVLRNTAVSAEPATLVGDAPSPP